MRFLKYLLLIPFFAACSSEEGNQPNQKWYFDLKGFAEQESRRLKIQNPVVIKTVSHNGKEETKKIQINNWQSELEFITESDINKAAFKGSYTVIKKGNSITYIARNKDLKTRQVQLLLKKNNQPAAISVTNEVNNFLYSSKQHLTYIPDSVYQLQRSQDVILLGISKFSVLTRFKN